MTDPDNLEERTLDVLEEILKWTKVTSIPHVKKTLESVLSSDDERRAYHHSTGDTSRKVADLAGVSHGTIARWWKKWHRSGLGEMRRVRGGSRFVRSFDLEDFGIPVPSLSKKERQGENG